MNSTRTTDRVRGRAGRFTKGWENFTMNQILLIRRNRGERRVTPASERATAQPAPGATVRRLPNILGQAALLEWLGQEPVTFHRIYVDIAGGVLPALWLSIAMDRVSKARPTEFTPDGDYYFFMSATECEQVTGLTRSQQASCRKHLVAHGLLSEDTTTHRRAAYTLHLKAVAQALLRQSAPLAERIAGYGDINGPLPDAALQTA